MRAKNFLIIILTLSTFLLTGCYNKKELDNLAYVIALGADIGSGDELNITYQIAVPVKISSDSGKTGEENYITHTVTANSLFTGNSKVNSLTSKEVNLSHVKLIVYSEELAKQDLSGHINSLVSNVAIRPKTTVALCKGKAKDFLENITPNLEASPARYYELLFESQKYTDDTIASELINFYSTASALDQATTLLILSNQSGDEEESSKTKNEENTKNEQQITGISNKSDQSEKNGAGNGGGDEEKSEDKKNKSETKFLGIAAFNGGKMVGTIPEELVASHLILTSSLKNGNITVDDVEEKNKLASIHLRQNKCCKFDVNIQNETPEINITINLTAKLQSSNSTTDYLTNKNKNALKEKIEEKLEEQLNEYFKLTQELNSDIAGIGKYVKTKYLTWEEFEKSNWHKNYKNAKINVKVNVDLNVSRVISHTVPNV